MMLNDGISKEELKLLDKWWDENEAQFLEESGHMSEYHMALVVWNARANYGNKYKITLFEKQTSKTSII